MEEINELNLEREEANFTKLDMVSRILKTRDRRIQARGVIVQVRTNKSSGQKLVTIPSMCDIEKGDYVLIKKVKV